MPLVLAHGALGPLDEIFLLLAVGIFAFMLISPLVSAWLKRDSQAHAAPAPDSPPPQTPNTEDYFRLD